MPCAWFALETVISLMIPIYLVSWITSGCFLCMQCGSEAEFMERTKGTSPYIRWQNYHSISVHIYWVISVSRVFWSCLIGWHKRDGLLVACLMWYRLQRYEKGAVRYNSSRYTSYLFYPDYLNICTCTCFLALYCRYSVF